jgi:plasmid stabilization system protein ParE
VVRYLGHRRRKRVSEVPQIIITEAAVQGLERCRLFLREKNPLAATRATQAIKNSLALLQTEPEIGRPVEDLPELRELIIPFGDSGYVALYRYETKTSSLYVLAFRHQKEAGY